MLKLENKEVVLNFENTVKEQNGYVTEIAQISNVAKYFAYKNRSKVEFLKFFVV